MNYQHDYLKSGRIMYVDSKNRINGTSSNFQLNLQLPNNTWDHVVLMQASIPKSWYLISNILNNNTFVYQEGSGVLNTITIPNGSYNKISMTIVLKSLLQSVTTFGLNAFSITYSNNQSEQDTFKYTFSSISTTISKLIFSNNNLATILGFNNNSTNSFSTIPLIAPNAYNFASITRLFIKSTLSNYADRSILQEIFQSQPDQSIVYYNQLEINSNAKLFTENNDDIFSFVIQDRYGNVVDLNGVDWVCSLLFFNIDDTNEFIKNDIILRNLKDHSN